MSMVIRFSDTATAELFNDPATGFHGGVLARDGAMTERKRAESHLLLVIAKGQATIVAHGRRHTIGSHQAITLPVGTEYEWQQENSTVAYYAALGQPIVRPGEGESVAPIRPDELGELVYCPPPAEASLRGAIPDQLMKHGLVDTTRQWSAGYWQSTGYYRVTQPFPKHEFMLVLSGKLSLTCPGEEAQVFGPGEALIIPAGTVCDWDTPGMSKIYSSFVPAKN